MNPRILALRSSVSFYKNPTTLKAVNLEDFKAFWTHTSQKQYKNILHSHHKIDTMCIQLFHFKYPDCTFLFLDTTVCPYILNAIRLIHSRMSYIIPLVQLISSKPLHFKLTKLTTHKERCHLIEFSWLKLFECLICCTKPLHLLLSIINKMFTLKIIWKRHSNCIKIPCCWLLT